MKLPKGVRGLSAWYGVTFDDVACCHMWREKKKKRETLRQHGNKFNPLKTNDWIFAKLATTLATKLSEGRFVATFIAYCL
jgi:hypothetical protein